MGILSGLKNFLGGAKRVVGVDFGSSAVKIVILKKEGEGSYVFEQGHVIPIPYDVASIEFLIEKQDFLFELKSIWNALGLNKYESSLALPGSATMLKRAKIEYVPEDKLEDVVRQEIEKNFPFKLHEITYDYYVYESNPSEGIDILYIIARKDLIEVSMRIFEAVGAYLSSIDSPLTSLANIAILSYPDMEKETGYIVLDIGYKNTRLVVIHQERIVYGRNIAEVGAVIVNQRIADFKGVDLTEAEQLKLSGEVEESFLEDIASLLADNLAREIELCAEQFSEFVQGSNISHILITGGGSNTPYIVDELKKRTQFEIKAFSPLKGIKLGKDLNSVYIDDMAPRLAVALGAALNLLIG